MNHKFKPGATVWWKSSLGPPWKKATVIRVGKKILPEAITKGYTPPKFPSFYTITTSEEIPSPGMGKYQWADQTMVKSYEA